MNLNLLSNSPDATLTVGRNLGTNLKGKEIILLCGGLGAGKTLICKGISSALDIPAEEVVSPTFTLMNIYEGRFRVFHFDLYRLGEGSDMASLGFDEYLNEGVFLIEWAQFLPQSATAPLERLIWINLEYRGASDRLITIQTDLDYISFQTGDI